MPRVTVTSLTGTLVIQDPMPASGGLSIQVPALGSKTFNCTWEVFQRLAPQIASLETLGVATFSLQAVSDNYWAQEGDLPNMPRIDRVSKHDLILAGEVGLTIEGLYFLAGQSYAENTTPDAVVDNRVRVLARTPGSWGNTLSYEIIDSGGGGLAVSMIGTVLTVDKGGAASTSAQIAAAINGDAVISLVFQALGLGTGLGVTALTAARDLTGGEGTGMAVTCAGVACDITTITGTAHPVYSMTVDVPTMAGVSGAGEGVNLELRTNSKVATISLQIVP